jgi:nucleoside-diphosphate-sugar epimerase
LHLLVTGNQGFIGPVLVRLAQARGHTVTGLDVGYFEDCVSRPQADARADRQISRDIRDVRAADLDGIDAVIHLAGLSNDPMGALDAQLTHDINLEGTLNLARLAKAAGVSRFVFASSCSIYGAAGGDRALDEHAPLEPVSAYAVSKARSEEGLAALADGSFSPVFMRNATAYGLGPRPRFDLVVNNLAGWAFTTGVVRVMSDGSPWRPLTHIEDISLAAICAFPASRLQITGETGGDPRSYRVDFSKALNGLPGFSPKWTLERGVGEVADWVKAEGLKDNAFDSRLFIRLKQLQYDQEQGLLDRQLRRIG